MWTSGTWKGWLFVALGVLAAVCSLSHLHFVDRGTTRESDLLAPYVAARTALRGGDAYALTTTQEIQRQYYGHVLRPDVQQDQQAFAYPLFTVYLVAPLTVFTLHGARLLFVAMAIPLLAGCTLLWIRLLAISIPPRQAALCLLYTFASWPVMVALRQQQLTLLLFALLTVGIYAWMRGHHVGAGILLGLCTIKPQFSLLPLVWVMVTAVYRRQPRLLASMAATILLLFVSAETLYRGWLREWIHVLGQYRRYTDSHPAFLILFGNRVGGIGLAMVGIIVCIVLWRMHDMEASRAVSLLLALSVTVCPTTPHWIYNQILLLPAALLVCFDIQARQASGIVRRVALGIIAWGFVAVGIAVLGENFFRWGHAVELLPYVNYVLPPVLTAAIAAGSLREMPDATSAVVADEDVDFVVHA